MGSVTNAHTLEDKSDIVFIPFQVLFRYKSILQLSSRKSNDLAD